MSQKIRQEINIQTDNTTSSASVTWTQQIVQLDTTKYSGTPTYYLEVLASAIGDGASTISLRRNGTTTDDVTVAIPTVNTLFRSTAFTPPAGATEYVLRLDIVTLTNNTIKLARIIVLQNENAITATETQLELGRVWLGISLTNTAVADLPGKFWKYTAANWDGTKTFFAEICWQTSAKNTCTITLCRTSDNATNVTVVSAGTSSTGYTRTRVSFTPVDGETYKFRALGSTTKSSYTTSCAKIVVDQTTFTKCEPQFILIGRQDINATGVQNYLTKWDSSEWDAAAGTITYYHVMDSDNASNSCKLRDITASADISNSTVTGTGQQTSAALGSFTSGNTLDVWVLDTTGFIYASRILIVYVFVAWVIPEITTEPLRPKPR